jgi:ABC-2 type transport system permease protein
VIIMLQQVALLFVRHLRKSLRSPVWILVGLFEPVLYLLLFMPLLKGLGGAPGLPAGGIERTFVPGLLVMLAIFTAGFVGFGVVDDKRIGFVERLMVTPVRRSAILLSMIARDLVMLIAQTLVVTVLSLVVGLSMSFLGFCAGLLMLVLVGVVMASFSYAVALLVTDEGNLASIANTVYMPILLLSGIMLPLTLAPRWLQIVAKFNPFSYIVDAERLLFSGTFNQAAIWQAFVIVIVLAVATTAWATSTLRKLSA